MTNAETVWGTFPNARVLGHGVLNNPRGERISGNYGLVGLEPDDPPQDPAVGGEDPEDKTVVGEEGWLVLARSWQRVRPDGDRQGSWDRRPGWLVFIPDEEGNTDD